jgi:hypothetical protein
LRFSDYFVHYAAAFGWIMLVIPQVSAQQTDHSYLSSDIAFTASPITGSSLDPSAAMALSADATLVPSSTPSASSGAAEGSRTCSGSARVLRGNPALIGQLGAFSAPYAGNIYVTPNSAAIIPSQWGSTRAFLRPFLSQITGTFPLINAGFQGASDIIGGAPPTGFRPNSNVQADLMMLYRDHLILELPGAPYDYGITTVVLTIPTSLSCPVGTTEI